MKFLSCPLSALLLLSFFLDPGAKGQVIPVPEKQPPVFYGHYGYPIADVLLTYTYLSPYECPVNESSKLQDTFVEVPRGGTIMNAIEIAANFDPSSTFEAQYTQGHGYFLTKLNNIPPEGEDPFCQWTWTSDPEIFPPLTTDLSISDVYLPVFFLQDPQIHFIYHHILVSSPRESVKERVLPPKSVVASHNIIVYYQVVGSSCCSLPGNVSGIPPTPITVSVPAGSSALNVMERATDLDPNLQFTIANSFGIFYFPRIIAGISEIPGCIWCLTYQPPNSQDTIVPGVYLQNFVIPVSETTLLMEYTSTCLPSEFHDALARKNMTYFREKGIVRSHASKKDGSVQKECCCDQGKSSYEMAALILALVLFISSLFLCTRYFR